MRAIAITEPGGPEVLQIGDVATPSPTGQQVQIRVAAAGVNRPDCLQRLGRYPVPPDASPLPGLEVAGQIVAVGDAVQRWQVGDEVMALTHGGGYAEFCVADQGHCLGIPPKLSAVEAAAIPETFFTVWYNVFTRGGLQAGETLLVHGGSSGIGSTAIQLAKAFGCSVITTAGSDEKCTFCAELGADHAINYQREDWQATVADITAGKGVDVILDMVAGSYAQKNLDSLARDGRYVIIAFLQGARVDLNLGVVLAKRLTVTGSTLRPQTTEEKTAIANDLEREVLPLLREGKVRPIVYETFTLDNAADAHTLMESSRHMGKIVLTVAGDNA